MSRVALLPRGVWSAVVVCALASLVFLGSPGCGCGDDVLVPERPPQCCCTFEWLPPRDIADANVLVVIESQDASLDAVASPSVLTAVAPLQARSFRVCVNTDHVLGAQLTLVLRGQGSGTEYGRAILYYDQRCRPVIEPISNNLNLITTDCDGGDTLECCCVYEWLPPTFTPASVNLTLQNVSASLNPTIFPTTLNNVQPGVVQSFTICIAADHALLDSLDLVITENGGGGLELGQARIVYRLRCTPEIGEVPGAPRLDLGSDECGPPLECCCDFEWLVPSNAFGDVQFTTQGLSPGLSVSITPSLFQDVEQQSIIPFRVCVNADHNLLDQFTLVATTTPGGQELGRMQFVYRQRCNPDIFDVPDFLGLQLNSLTCGQTQCCCTLRLTTDPEFWNTPNITLSLENVGATLVPATISPNTFTGVSPDDSIDFDVCVNSEHQVDETMEIVITETGTTNVITRVPLTYDPTCVAVPGPDTSGLVSEQNLGCDVLGPVGLKR